jgi:peptidoglycan/LPS O-acetylase OafA/YrhL
MLRAMSLSQVAANELTAGRAWSLAGAVFGLAGIVSGVLALRRRRGAVVAVGAGVVGIIIGALVVVMAKGGPGTGYGVVGGYVSLVLGVAAAALGGLAMRRGARAAARRAG